MHRLGGRRLGRAVDRVDGLDALDDEVGEVIDIRVHAVELGRREAFVYIDGEVCVGVTHARAVGDYCRANGLTEAVARQLAGARFTGRAPSGCSLAYGHLTNDVAVVEADRLFNVTLDEVVAALRAMGVAKVYTAASFMAGQVTRVARGGGS